MHDWESAQWNIHEIDGRIWAWNFLIEVSIIDLCSASYLIMSYYCSAPWGGGMAAGSVVWRQSNLSLLSAFVSSSLWSSISDSGGQVASGSERTCESSLIWNNISTFLTAVLAHPEMSYYRLRSHPSLLSHTPHQCFTRSSSEEALFFFFSPSPSPPHAPESVHPLSLHLPSSFWTRLFYSLRRD